MDGKALFGGSAVAQGRIRHAVARLFQLSPSAVIKWTKPFDGAGSVAAKPMGGVRRDALGEHRAWLRTRLTEKPDLKLEALRTELAARGHDVSVWTIWKFCRSEKLTFKKSLLPSEQLRARVSRWRERWKRLQPRLDPARLVFIDETWAKTNMTRTHGRAPRGRRLHARSGAVPALGEAVGFPNRSAKQLGRASSIVDWPSGIGGPGCNNLYA